MWAEPKAVGSYPAARSKIFLHSLVWICDFLFKPVWQGEIQYGVCSLHSNLTYPLKFVLSLHECYAVSHTVCSNLRLNLFDLWGKNSLSCTTIDWERILLFLNHYLCSSAAQQTIRNQAKIGAFNALTRRENSFLTAKNDLLSVTEYPKKKNFSKILPF